MARIKKAVKAASKGLGLVFILPIRFYQKFISPMTPASCKYYPTCSAYAVEAYRKHGAVMGSVLTAWRLLRCNPWSYGGVDYVPDKITRIYFVPKNLRKENTYSEDERESRETEDRE